MALTLGSCAALHLKFGHSPLPDERDESPRDARAARRCQCLSCSSCCELEPFFTVSGLPFRARDDFGLMSQHATTFSTCISGHTPHARSEPENRRTALQPHTSLHPPSSTDDHRRDEAVARLHGRVWRVCPPRAPRTAPILREPGVGLRSRSETCTATVA